jgi:hypothetical protein
MAQGAKNIITWRKRTEPAGREPYRLGSRKVEIRRGRICTKPPLDICGRGFGQGGALNWSTATMPSDIHEAIGKSHAAFCLITAMLQVMMAKNVLSKKETITIVSAAIEVVSMIPETTKSERDNAVAMLSALRSQWEEQSMH